MNIGKKAILSLSCVICLTSCGNKAVSEISEDISDSVSTSAETEISTAKTTTAIMTTTTTTVTTTEFTEETTEAPFYFGDENEVPENAAYKQISKEYKGGKLQSRDIFFYDEHDNVIFILYQTNPESDKPSRITSTYEYNADGQIVSEDLDYIIGSAHINYEYNPNGTVSTSEKYDNDKLLASRKYFYNGLNEPIRIETFYTSDGGFSASSEYEYEYDDKGRVTEKRTNSQTTSYTSVESYVYDENDNITEWKEISGIGEQKRRYTYNSDNRKIREEYYYNGNQERYIEYEYENYN